MSTLLETGVQTYAIDPAHSRLGFSVRHMGFAHVHGSFEQFEGTFRMDPGDLSTMEAEAVAQVDSITTHDENRDAHLRSPDFFDAETHPTISFRSTEVRDVSDSKFSLVGDLTIRGVTKRVEFGGEYLGEGTDPWGGTRVGFRATTRINRKNYGLNWNAVLETGGFLVSDDVKLTLEVQAVLQEEQEA